MSNDRFKFRVWDNDIGIWVRATISSDGCLLGDYIYDQYIIEQCTGLCDKNGNLIYEGDIIRIEDNPNHDTTIRWIQDEGRFWFGFYDAAMIHKYGTIIGNIHEGVKEK